MRILVLEDEPKLARSLRRALESEGYAVDVEHTGFDALAAAQASTYDALLVDRMVPSGAPSPQDDALFSDGVQIIKTLRSKGIMTPAILVTALGTLDDKTTGLDAGADDYLVKPFAVDELLARVRALLRRPSRAVQPQITFAGFTLDQNQRQLQFAGKPVSLTSKEFGLLEYLLLRRGQVVSKEQLAEHVWDFDATILPNTIEAHIKQLRKKLAQHTKENIITTVRGFGYKIDAQPSEEDTL